MELLVELRGLLFAKPHADKHISIINPLTTDLFPANTGLGRLLDALPQVAPAGAGRAPQGVCDPRSSAGERA
jgi:hypothetical protein